MQGLQSQSAQSSASFHQGSSGNSSASFRHKSFKKKKEAEPKIFLVAFCLPKLSSYADREDVTAPIDGDRSQDRPTLALVTKTITTLLQTFEHAVEDAAEFYAGDVVSNMFSMIVCRFPTIIDALDGALLVEENLLHYVEKANKGDEEVDTQLIKYGAALPAAYIASTRGIGFVHTASDAHRPRVCAEELRLFQAVTKFADEFENFQLPGILVQLQFLPEIKNHFETRQCNIVIGDAHSETVRVVKRTAPRDQLELVDEAAVREAELRRLPRDVRKAWEKFDLNKDSELQRHEVHDVLTTLEYDLSEWEIDDFFDAIDEDHSGTVSVKEFASAFNGPVLGCAALTRDIKLAAKRIAAQTGVDSLPLIMEMWAKYDTSGDGSLDTGELHCVLLDMGVEVISQQEVQWLLNKFDEDDSGVVEFDEFSALVSTKTQRGASNPTKLKIGAAKRAAAPKLLTATPEQELGNSKVRKQVFFDRYIIYFLFFWMMYNSARATFRTFARNVVPDNEIQAIFDWCLDIFYFSWVIAKFIWLPWEDKGLYITDPKEIIKRYLRSPDIWVDIIVLLPLDIFYWTDPSAMTIGFYRLNKVFSLYYLPYTFDMMTHAISPTYGAVVRTIMWFIMAAHFFGCLFVEVSHSVGSEATEDVFEVAGLVDSDQDSRSLLHLRVVYWAMLCLAGQIQGDGIPQLDIHVGLLLLVAISGLPLYAMLLATFSSVNEIESAENMYQQRLDRVMSYASYFEFDDAFHAGSIAYFRHVFNTTGSLNLEYELPHDMPEALEILMNIEVGTDFLSKVPVFAKVMESPSAGALINELVSRMKTRIIEPSTIVAKRGEDSVGMCFVQDGYFLGLGEHDRELFKCGRGNFFGEIELLLGKKNIVTIVSADVGYSNLLVVSKSDFEDVMTYFPDALTTLCDTANERYDQLVGNENTEASRRIAEERLALANEFASGVLSEEQLLKAVSQLDVREREVQSRGGKRATLQFGKTSEGGGDLSQLGQSAHSQAFGMMADDGSSRGGSSAGVSPRDGPIGGPNDSHNRSLSDEVPSSTSTRHLQSVSFGLNTPKGADSKTIVTSFTIDKDTTENAAKSPMVPTSGNEPVSESKAPREFAQTQSPEPSENPLVGRREMSVSGSIMSPKAQTADEETEVQTMEPLEKKSSFSLHENV